MFGLFSTRCPVETGFKTWAESRFLDLAHAVGLSTVHDAEVLDPAHPELPLDFRGSDECCYRVFDLIARRMAILPGSVSCELVDETELKELTDASAGGLYFEPQDENARPQILISSSLRSDPERLLAVMAHELAHEAIRLRIPLLMDESDLEVCTDVVPALYGLGVFMANSTLREECESTGNWFSWTWSQSGYLTAEGYGYVLALFAWIRGELSPPWARHLRLDARDTLTSGLKFLDRTHDCLIDPHHPVPRNRKPSRQELSQWLRDESDTWKMQALNDLAERPEDAAELQREIVRLLSAKDYDLVFNATHVLSLLVTWTPQTHQELLVLQHHRTPNIRSLLASILGPGTPDDDQTIATLCHLLSDIDVLTCSHAAESLADFDSIPGEACRTALDVLQRLIAAGDECSSVLMLLSSARDDFEEFILAHIGDDPDLRVHIEHEMAEFHRAQEEGRDRPEAEHRRRKTPGRGMQYPGRIGSEDFQRFI